MTDFLQCCIQILFLRLLLIIALQTLVSSVKIRPELVYSKCQDFIAFGGDSDAADYNFEMFDSNAHGDVTLKEFLDLADELCLIFNIRFCPIFQF